MVNMVCPTVRIGFLRTFILSAQIIALLLIKFMYLLTNWCFDSGLWLYAELTPKTKIHFTNLEADSKTILLCRDIQSISDLK